jgi:thiol-disulfide isomerase/thioredoxin
MVEGDVFKGVFSLEGISPEKIFRWDCPSFTESLLVPWSNIDSVSFDRPRTHRNGVKEKFIVEFWSGDCLTGEMVAVDKETVTLKSDLFGPQRIAFGSIRMFLRVIDGDEKEAGSLSPMNWNQLIPKIRKDGDKRWVAKVGSLTTETAGTSVFQEVFIPDVCSLEIDVAWPHSSPNWVLTVGSPRKLELHVRKLEQRNEVSVTLLFEESDTADIATAVFPFEGMESIRLRLLSDYVRGRFAMQMQGKTIGEVRSKEKLRSGGKQPIMLTNVAAGGINLRDLRVSRSVFSISDSKVGSKSDKGVASPLIMLSSGDSFPASPEGFDPDRSSISFRSQESNREVPLQEIERIEFPLEPVRPPNPQGAWPTRDASNPSPLCFIELQNGDRYSGTAILHLGNTLKIIDPPAAPEIVCDVRSIGSIQVQRNVPVISAKRDQESVRSVERSRLMTADVSSFGMLADSASESAAGDTSARTLRWEARGMVRAASLRSDVDGSIDFYPQGNAEKENEEGRIRKDLGGSRNELKSRFLEPGEPSLFLLSGDSIPAKMDSLRDGVLHLGSEYFGNTKITSSLVRGYRNLVYTGLDAVPKEVMDRLLSVPRIQRKDPPTHLIVSNEGDAVRGKIVEMDLDTISVEVRGELRTLWMKNVAEIIWLDPVPPVASVSQTESTDETVQPNDPPAPGLMCQVLVGQGTRISVIPQAVKNDSIEGVHPQLGECRIPLKDCIRMTFGDEITNTAKSSRFAKWQLRNAPDPKFVQEEKEEADNAAGRSKLIGIEAPSFNLERLDGTRAQLDLMMGKVVVVDFWASWCGPCMKSLPGLAKLTSEFPESDLEFVAINSEEPLQLVHAAAAGLRISNKVAVDADGAISKLYGVKSIPFTVIIDRKGIVRKVFVGADGDTPQRLRDAIAEVLELAQ